MLDICGWMPIIPLAERQCLTNRQFFSTSSFWLYENNERHVEQLIIGAIHENSSTNLCGFCNNGFYVAKSRTKLAGPKDPLDLESAEEDNISSSSSSGGEDDDGNNSTHQQNKPIKYIVKVKFCKLKNLQKLKY